MSILFDPEIYPLPAPNMGPPAAELFPWKALAGQVQHIRTEQNQDHLS
jgi:hypothetical protein